MSIGKFKQFDINPTDIILDGQTIACPRYVSPSDWVSFWAEVRSLEEDGSIEKQVANVAAEIEDDFENDLDTELEKQESDIYSQLDRALDKTNASIRTLLEDHGISEEIISKIEDFVSLTGYK